MKKLDLNKESEILYKTLVNNLPNPILIHINGKVVFANDVILEVTGHGKDEIIGKNISGLFIDPLDIESHASLKDLFSDFSLDEKEIEIRSGNRNVVLKNLLLRNRKIKYKGRNAVMSILIDITERKHLEKYILSRVIATEEKDRKQFAIDLHDDLGPILSSIKIHLSLLDNSRDPQKFSDDLNTCMTLLNESISKMRIIANNLMPRLIDNWGIEAALNSFIKIMQKEGVFCIDFISNLNGARFQKQIELHLYRIICELVNNTVKHSNAKKAIIRLNFTDHILSLFYTDNGKGYHIDKTHQKPPGMGISNIIHRVNLIDGKIKFTEKKGKTEVRIWKELLPG